MRIQFDRGLLMRVSAHTATLEGMSLGVAELVELMAVADLFSGFHKSEARRA